MINVEYPVKFQTLTQRNIAPISTINVSSTAPGYSATGLTDGVNAGDWMSANELAPWAWFTFYTKQVTNKIRVYDRDGTVNNVTDATVSFFNAGVWSAATYFHGITKAPYDCTFSNTTFESVFIYLGGSGLALGLKELEIYRSL